MDMSQLGIASLGSAMYDLFHFICLQPRDKYYSWYNPWIKLTWEIVWILFEIWTFLGSFPLDIRALFYLEMFVVKLVVLVLCHMVLRKICLFICA